MVASQLALSRPDSEFLTDDTQSRLRADYSPDTFVMRVAPTKPEVVDAAVEDEVILLQTAPAGLPSTRIEPRLVPTPTPLPVEIPSPTPAATATPSRATPAT